MFKKVLLGSSILVSSLLLHGSPTALASNPIQLEANGAVYSAKKDFTVVDGHVYVKFKTLTSIIDASNRWNNETSEIARIITEFSDEANDQIFWHKNSKKVTVSLDGKTETINMKLSTITKDKKMLIPLREAITMLNKLIDIQLEWEGKEKKVVVTGKLIY
ncbi:hypothetical protein [Paenibacillus herberti]|uniref:Copper amine oxidase-like N-terminal domain-containing protein n=1 Tax=Paenibacillus herberti TaxID=1619309 RepID=A0A229NWG3_9BACL|nr:hypothetical protein [Paenibacillus herberti]OXM13979.1 hypothetical protein CGZ75_13310 [Paenibacillus herberti]